MARLATSLRSFFPALGAACVLALATPGAWAEAAPDGFVLDPGTTPEAQWPAWLHAAALGADSTLGSAAYEVTPPADAAGCDLLLTAVFDEAAGGFLRVYLQRDDGAEMIAENLEEGTGLAASRTLRIPLAGAAGPTRIVFQWSAAAQAPPLRRLAWEWTRTLPVPVAGALPGAVRHGAALPLAETAGDAAPPLPEVEAGRTVTPLQDGPARAEGGGALAFSVVLDRLPARARLAGKVLGLPLGAALECRVNGRRAGTFAAGLPPFSDPAYLFSPDGTPFLAAWRDGTLFVPGTLWHPGENTVELRPAPGSAPLPAYALKALVLDLAYDAAPPPPAAPAPSL